MDRKETIDQELERLHMELTDVHGGPCEVVQRICGYYRNINHFNIGKREEYANRVNFGLPTRDKSESMIQLHQG